jgi:hypothetical protein
VVDGSIHRAATRISTATDQRSATPMRNHRTKDRREPFRCGVFRGVSGFSVTLQNNRLGWIDIAPSTLSAHRHAAEKGESADRRWCPTIFIKPNFYARAYGEVKSGPTAVCSNAVVGQMEWPARQIRGQQSNRAHSRSVQCFFGGWKLLRKENGPLDVSFIRRDSIPLLRAFRQRQ